MAATRSVCLGSLLRTALEKSRPWRSGIVCSSVCKPSLSANALSTEATGGVSTTTTTATSSDTHPPARPSLPHPNAKEMYSQADAMFDDMSMRKLITGIYPKGISDVIIKRKENLAYITFYVYQDVYPSVLYFLKGFSERLLGRWQGLKVTVDVRYAPHTVPPKTKKKAYRLGQTWDSLTKTGFIRWWLCAWHMCLAQKYIIFYILLLCCVYECIM